jgi:hypothetical protein
MASHQIHPKLIGLLSSYCKVNRKTVNSDNTLDSKLIKNNTLSMRENQLFEWVNSN